MTLVQETQGPWRTWWCVSVGLLSSAVDGPGPDSLWGGPLDSLAALPLQRGVGRGPTLSFVPQERLGFVDSAWEHLQCLWPAFVPRWVPFSACVPAGRRQCEALP